MSQRARAKVISGIDGCKGGWVIAEDRGAARPPAFQVVGLRKLGPIFDLASAGSAVVAIDMPIGLPDHSPRACDYAARQIVGAARASSVFPVPCRAAVYADGQDPSLLNEKKTGRKLSKQSLAILGRIREVDALMTPELQAYVREAHPEVTFAVLNGRPLKHGKKTKDGERERLCLLKKAGIDLDFDMTLAALRQQLPPGCHVSRDDVIDAAACLATARRIMLGAAQPVAPLDEKRLRMEIVA